MPHDESDRPLISCILPTYNRRAFLPHAIRYFLRQDYPNKELLVVDDGADSVADLIPSDPRIRYVRLPQKVTLGAKLNLCCEQALGPVIAQWDDDDWYAPDRLSRQLTALLQTGAEVCGLSDLLYFDLRRGSGHRYVYPAGERPWLLGSSLFFRRELWARNRFAEVDVGMDALFVWATAAEKVHSLPEPRFAVHLIHHTNVSPKSPVGAWWSDHPVSDIAGLMGADWRFYEPAGEILLAPRPCPPGDDAPPLKAHGIHLELVTEPAEIANVTNIPKVPRNVYACLVHEARDCVIDLARNLRHVDPESTILLYDGGHDPSLLAPDPTLDQLGVVVHPRPSPMRWGSLHQFALDCMRFGLAERPFDTLTIVDSDQLALRPGWTARLAECLAAQEKQGGRVGLFGNRPERLPPHTDISAAITAWQEFELWRPLLRRFPDGESKFVHWTFWPSTVFTADAARSLVDLFDHDQQLQQIMRHSRLWVTEEIVFPTLTALLGFEVARSPGSYDYVRYQYPYTNVELNTALSRPDGYWIHPVARRYDDPVRAAVRGRFEQYRAAAPTPRLEVPAPAPPTRQPDIGEGPSFRLEQLRPSIVAQMRQVPGWLADDEADLLITMTGRALAACPDVQAVVEVGSFRGKATTVLAGVVRGTRPAVRVAAVDPHDGVVGAVDQGLHHEGPTLESFRQNIARAGLEGFVQTIQSRAPEVAWSEPICLLLIDGLHDYGNVARDFLHFERFLARSALVVFHDYADYYPGVRTFVDELIHSGRYLFVDKASSLIVLGKVTQGSEAVADEPGPPLEARLAL
jgi:glycosyltransferase involved in cell wall biosynthesis